MRQLLLLVLVAGCSLPRPKDVPDPDAPPPTFAVGGQVVSMWPGASVTLLLASGATTEQVVVHSNGPFAFQSRLGDGAPYEVTVAQTPAMHTCTIDAGQGNVADADVSIHVDCRAVQDIQVSAGTPWTFDPAAFSQSIPLSILGRTSSVTIYAPDASSIAIDGAPTASGIASSTFDTSATNAVTVAITIGSVSHTYTLTFMPGDTPIAQVAYVKAPNTDAGDLFGTAVAAYGPWLVVGAPNEASAATGIGGDETDNSTPGTGAVYLYQRTGDAWSFVAYIKQPSPGYTMFGRSLALSATHLVIGTSDCVIVYPFDASSGHVVTPGVVLIETNGEEGDQFGASVALDGDVVVVGAPDEDSSATTIDGNGADNSSTDSGAAYVFAETSSTWYQVAYLKANDNQPLAHFGTSLAIDSSGATQSILVGAPGQDSSGTATGEIYRFDDSGSGWSLVGGSAGHTCCVAAGQALGTSVSFDATSDTLAAGTGPSGSLPGLVALGDQGSPVFATMATAPNPVGPAYGASVVVSNGRLAVGDPSESGGGVGIDPTYSNDRPNSGAVYLFGVSALVSNELSYIKSSNSRRDLGFGTAVSMTSNVLAVGAPHEASAATGVDGNQLDASAVDAGAVYIFQ